MWIIRQFVKVEKATIRRFENSPLWKYADTNWIHDFLVDVLYREMKMFGVVDRIWFVYCLDIWINVSHFCLALRMSNQILTFQTRTEFVRMKMRYGLFCWTLVWGLWITGRKGYVIDRVSENNTLAPAPNISSSICFVMT